MKKALLVLIVLLTFLDLQSQEECNKTLQESLNEISLILNEKKSTDLWNKQLNADILFVNPAENKMYITSIQDGEVAEIVEKEWNNTVGLANTALMYNGKKYVVIIYNAFIEPDCEGRARLLIHEIFHYHQEELGLPMVTSENVHLDKPVGRVLLHMEFDALKDALSGSTNSLADALYIRQYRQSLFSDNNENLFELNEGLAEYTGAKLATRDKLPSMLQSVSYNINRGYTNSFAYCTGPVYGYFLDSLYPEWKQDPDLKNGLSFLLKKTGKLNIPQLDELYTQTLLKKYNYEDYLKEEAAMYGDPSEYENLLDSTSRKLFMPNNGINIFFNPNDRVISLRDKAVLLKNVTLKAKWGEAKVINGAVRMNDWSAFILLPPVEINGTEIKGKDYIINLNPDWQIVEKDNIWKFELKN